MTYWVNVASNTSGFAILNASFFSPTGAAYASQSQNNGWYIVGVGPNQDFFARAPGYYDSIRLNTDAVDPNYYYFWLRMNPVPPPPPPPSPPSGGGWL